MYILGSLYVCTNVSICIMPVCGRMAVCVYVLGWLYCICTCICTRVAGCMCVCTRMAGCMCVCIY